MTQEACKLTDRGLPGMQKGVCVLFVNNDSQARHELTRDIALLCRWVVFDSPAEVPFKYGNVTWIRNGGCQCSCADMAACAAEGRAPAWGMGLVAQHTCRERVERVPVWHQVCCAVTHSCNTRMTQVQRQYRYCFTAAGTVQNLQTGLTIVSSQDPQIVAGSAEHMLQKTNMPSHLTSRAKQI